MDARGTARLFQELSNFYCHPGRAGGSPLVTRESMSVSIVRSCEVMCRYCYLTDVAACRRAAARSRPAKLTIFAWSNPSDLTKDTREIGAPAGRWNSWPTKGQGGSTGTKITHFVTHCLAGW